MKTLLFFELDRLGWKKGQLIKNFLHSNQLSLKICLTFFCHDIESCSDQSEESSCEVYCIIGVQQHVHTNQTLIKEGKKGWGSAKSEYVCSTTMNILCNLILDRNLPLHKTIPVVKLSMIWCQWLIM